MTRPTNDQRIDLGDRTLRVRRLTPQRTDGLERTTLVFLHEGLGCIEMWRDFPQRLCDVLQCNGVVYDRTAYGKSSPWPADPGLAYMEIEADVVLPRLLAALRSTTACWSATATAARSRSTMRPTTPSRCAPW